MEVFKLFGSLSLDKDKFSSELKGAEGEAQGFGGKMQSIFATIGTYVVAAFAAKKVLDFVKDSLAAFADFEAKTTKMFATMDPLPDDVKAKVIADIKDISEQYHILATDVVDAFDLAGDLGVPVDELKAFMGPAAELAKVLGIDLQSSAGALAKTVQALGGDFSKTAEIADLFFKVAETGDVDVNTLQVTFSKLLPVAQELGIGMDELAAYIATVAQQGVPTRSAVSGIQAIFEELSDSTKGVGLAFKAITGQSFPEFIKGGGTLAQALEIVSGSSGETQEAITSLSDTTSDAAKVFAAISGKTFPEFIASGGKIEDAMKIAAGGVGKAAKAFDDLQLSNAAVSKAVTDFVARGGSMETALKTIASKSVDAAKAFDALYDSNSEVSKAFEALAGKTFPEFIKQGGTLEQALVLVGKATESVGGSATSAKVPLTQMFTSIEAGKIVLNTTGEKAALLKTNLDSMATAATGAASALSKAWLDMSQTSEEKAKAMQVAVNSFQITFGGMADSILKPLNTVAASVLGSIMGLVTSVTSLLTGDFQAAWNGLENFFKGLYDSIIAIFNLVGIGDAIKNGLASASTAIVTFFTQVVPKWGTTITDGIKAGLAAGWTSVVNWFKGAWDGLINALTSWMPGFLKKWLGVGEDSAKQYADGLDAAGKDAQNAAGDMVEGAVGEAEDGADAFSDAGQESGEGYSDGISASESDAAKASGGVVETALNEFHNRASDFLAPGGESGLSFAIGIGDTEGHAADASLDVAGFALDALADTAADFLGAGESSGQEYASGIEGSAGEAADAAAEVVEEAISVGEAGTPEFGAIGEDATLSYADGIESQGDTAADAMGDVVEGALDVMETTQVGLIDAIDKLTFAIESSFGDVVDASGEMVDGVEGKVGTLPDSGMEAGKAFSVSLGDGIGDKAYMAEGAAFSLGKDTSFGASAGIISGLPDIQSAAEDMAQTPIDTATDILQTRSPSKAMEEIGENVSLGLAEGIDGAAGEVEDSVDGVVEVVTDGFGEMQVKAEELADTLGTTLVDGVGDALASLETASEGSYDHAQAIDDVQGEYRKLIDARDLLIANGIEVDASLEASIGALEATGLALDDTGRKTDDLGEKADKLAEDFAKAWDSIKSGTESAIKDMARSFMDMGEENAAAYDDYQENMDGIAADAAETKDKIDADYADSIAKLDAALAAGSLSEEEFTTKSGELATERQAAITEAIDAEKVKLDEAKDKWQETRVTIGSILKDFAGNVVDTLKDTAAQFVASQIAGAIFGEKTGGVFSSIAGAATGSGNVLGGVFAAIGGWFTKLLGGAQGASAGVGTAMAGMGAAATGTGVTFGSVVQSIGGWFSKLINGAQGASSGVGAALSGMGATASTVGGGIGGTLAGIATGLGNMAASAVSGGNIVGTALSTAGTAVGFLAKEGDNTAKAIGFASSAIGTVTSIMSGNVIGAVTGVVGIFKNMGGAWDWLKETAGPLWDSIAGAVKGAFEGIGDFFGGIWNGIKSGVSSIWDWITGKSKTTVEAVAKDAGAIIEVSEASATATGDAASSAIIAAAAAKAASDALAQTTAAAQAQAEAYAEMQEDAAAGALRAAQAQADYSEAQRLADEAIANLVVQQQASAAAYMAAYAESVEASKAAYEAANKMAEAERAVAEAQVAANLVLIADAQAVSAAARTAIAASIQQEFAQDAADQAARTAAYAESQATQAAAMAAVNADAAAAALPPAGRAEAEAALASISNGHIVGDSVTQRWLLLNAWQNAGESFAKLVSFIGSLTGTRLEKVAAVLEYTDWTWGNVGPIREFGEGFFAPGPALLGNALFGEVGPEALLPLNQPVLAKIGAGIAGAMQSNVTNQINWEGMFDGAVFNVAGENDAKVLARELFGLMQERKRGLGWVGA